MPLLRHVFFASDSILCTKNLGVGTGWGNVWTCPRVATLTLFIFRPFKAGGIKSIPVLEGWWRPRPESNRCTRICNPLHNHSATRPVQKLVAGANVSTDIGPSFLRVKQEAIRCFVSFEWCTYEGVPLCWVVYVIIRSIMPITWAGPIGQEQWGTPVPCIKATKMIRPI